MDRIDSEVFVPLAGGLPVGQSMRASHDCGQTPNTMIITRDVGKVTAHCFRCGGSGWYAEQENLTDKLKRLADESRVDSIAQASLTLPEPRVYDASMWPRSAALWLYKVGFSPSMIDKLGAYWCPDMGRVVLPVIEDGHAVFWQARSIHRTPKILSPRMPRRGVVGKYGKGRKLILCEDTLSAFKCSQITEAWSLLGTKLLDKAFVDILNGDYDEVIVWLDADKAGRVAAPKIHSKLRAYGIKTRDVCTPLDPKYYGRKFIEETINV